MKKLLLCLSLLNISLIHTEEKNEDCAKPTEYVMQFLKRSGTLWNGSTDWKNQFQPYFAKTIHTVYTKTQLKGYLGAAARLLRFQESGDYYGAFARFLKLNQTGTKAYFTIEKDGDEQITITSEMEDQEIHDLNPENEAMLLKLHARDNYWPVRELHTDDCTKCNYTLVRLYNEKTKKLSIFLSSKCTSKMPWRTFEDLMKKQS